MTLHVIYVTIITPCSTRKDDVDCSFGSRWRLQPSRRWNRSRVTQRLILADIGKLFSEWEWVRALVCYHIVAMVFWIWKLSRVSMTLPQQLGWLSETKWVHFALFLKIFKRLFCIGNIRVPHCLDPTPSLFRPVHSFALFCFVQRFFSSYFNQSDCPSPPSPAHHPLRTNWALWRAFCAAINTRFGQIVLCLLCTGDTKFCVCELLWEDFSSLCNSK